MLRHLVADERDRDRLLEVIPPAGLECYFRELAEIYAERGYREPQLVAELQERYGVSASANWIPVLKSKHGLKLLGE